MKFSYNKYSYQKYLQSNHWRRVRHRALREAGYQCECCGTSETILQAHHNSYDNLGCELSGDLNIYCSDCHIAEHNKTREVKEIIRVF